MLIDDGKSIFALDRIGTSNLNSKSRHSFFFDVRDDGNKKEEEEID